MGNEIKIGSATKEKLEAQIGELTAAIDVSDSKIEDLSASISKEDGELSEATSIREKEASDFAASEKELVETVDTLDRALSIISTEMAKNPAALAQVDSTSMTSLVKTMSTLVRCQRLGVGIGSNSFYFERTSSCCKGCDHTDQRSFHVQHAGIEVGRSWQ